MIKFNFKDEITLNKFNVIEIFEILELCVFYRLPDLIKKFCW